MLARKVRAAVSLLSVSASMALSCNAFFPAAAPAVEIIRGVVEDVFIEDAPDDDGWYIPGVRRYRCELVADMPPRRGGDIRMCSYDCRGYGAGATFPWPVSLPCPEGYNELMPVWPDGYPGNPYPSGSPSILAD